MSKSSGLPQKDKTENERIFRVGDRVFARLGTYPPWPAKVIEVFKVAKKIPMTKCKVQFYGSNDVAECIFKRIYDFKTFKPAFAKYRKVEGYEKALKSLKTDLCELGLMSDDEMDTDEDEREDVIELVEDVFESESDGSTLISSHDDSNDEDFNASGKKKKKKKKAAPRKCGSITKKGKKLKLSVSGEAADMKMTNEDDDNNRKFWCDNVVEFMDAFITQEISLFVPNDALNTKVHDLVREMAIQNHGFRITDPAGLMYMLESLKLTSKSGDDRDRNLYTTENVNKYIAQLKELKTLKEIVERGESIPNAFEPVLMHQQTETVQNRIQDALINEEIAIKTEAFLLTCFHLIRCNIGWTSIRIPPLKKAMDCLLSLDITHVMLKKHPEIVNCIARMYKTATHDFENDPSVSIEGDPEDVRIFPQLLKDWTDALVEKFSRVLPLPDGEQFVHYYFREYLAFRIEVLDGNLSWDEELRLVDKTEAHRPVPEDYDIMEFLQKIC